MNANNKQFIIYDKQFHFVLKVCKSNFEKSEFLKNNPNGYCPNDY